MSHSKTLINDMSQGPVLKSLTAFALPIMLSNVLQAVYAMVDMMVVGQFVGSAGLSAVGIGGQIQNLFLAVGMGFSLGGQIVISQQVGTKSRNMSKTIGTLLSMELILAILVGFIGVAARIGLSLLLSAVMGLPGFWLGSGLAGFVTTIVMGIYFLSGKWETRQLVTE